MSERAAHPTQRHIVLGLEVIDALTAQLTPDWTHATIDAEVGLLTPGGELHVVAVERTNAVDEPPEAALAWARFAASLGMDPRANTQSLGRALTELRAVLAARRMAWGGARVRCERDEGGAQLELLESDDSVSARLVVGPPDYRFRLLSHAFRDAALAAAEWLAQRGVGSLPPRDPASGFQGARYDREQGVLELVYSARTARVPVEVLGSYSHAEGSWCWAWANASYPQRATARVATLAAETPRDAGLGALFRPDFRCTSNFAAALAAVATARLDARDSLQLAYGAPPLEVYFVALDGAEQ